MADDDTTASPPEGDERTLAEMQSDLQAKQEELASLRAAREQEQVKAVEKVRKAQLADEIKKVDREIDNEKAMLENQKNFDADLVGSGTQPTGENPGTENSVDPAENVVGEAAPPVPETPEPDKKVPEAPAEPTTSADETPAPVEENTNQTLEYGAIPGYVAPEGSDQ